MAEVGGITHLFGGTYEKKKLEWKILHFSISDEKFHQCISPIFSFAGLSWYFNIDLDTNLDCIRFCLKNNTERNYVITYSLRLKVLPYEDESCISGFMKGKQLRSLTGLHNMPRDVQQNAALETDVNLVCYLKRKIKSNDAFKLLDLDKLSIDLKNLLDNKETSDVTLIVKDKECKAHKTVLIARSSVFAAAFKHEQTEVITISDCDADTFQLFLEYLYCGKLGELCFRNALDLCHTSNKYDVQELKAFCIKRIVKCLTAENICEAATFADINNEAELFSTVQDFFNKNVADILLTPKWEDLMKLHTNVATKLLIEMPKADTLLNLGLVKLSETSQELSDSKEETCDPMPRLTIENMCEVVCAADVSKEPALLSVLQEFFNKNVNNILQASEWKNFVKMHTGLANKLLIGMPKKKYDDVNDEEFDRTSMGNDDVSGEEFDHTSMGNDDVSGEEFDHTSMGNDVSGEESRRTSMEISFSLPLHPALFNQPPPRI